MRARKGKEEISCGLHVCLSNLCCCLYTIRVSCVRECHSTFRDEHPQCFNSSTFSYLATDFCVIFAEPGGSGSGAGGGRGGSMRGASANGAPPLALWGALAFLFVTNVVTLYSLTGLNVRYDQLQGDCSAELRERDLLLHTAVVRRKENESMILQVSATRVTARRIIMPHVPLAVYAPVHATQNDSTFRMSNFACSFRPTPNRLLQTRRTRLSSHVTTPRDELQVGLMHSFFDFHSCRCCLTNDRRKVVCTGAPFHCASEAHTSLLGLLRGA